MSPSPQIILTKADIISKIDIILQDSEDISVGKVQKCLESQKDISRTNSSFCINLWKCFFSGLNVIRESLSTGDNSKSLEHLYDSLNLIEIRKSDYKFKTTTSESLSPKYFQNFLDNVNACINPSSEDTNLQSETTTLWFRLQDDGKVIDKFAIGIDREDLRANIYEQIIKSFSKFDLNLFAIQIFGQTLCADKNLSIEASFDLTKFKLVYIDSNHIPIEPEKLNIINLIPIGKATLTIPELRPVARDERILFLVDLYIHKGDLKERKYNIAKVDEFINQHIIDKAEKVELFLSDEATTELRIVRGKFMRQDRNSSRFNVEIECSNFMRFKITLLRELGPLYDSLNVNLTTIGDSQFVFIENHLKQLRFIYEESKIFYAPFSGLIQSSGFGKTKLCLDLLLKHPGIYFVFRKDEHTGVPRMSNWMVKCVSYIKGADFDDLPVEGDMNKSIANSTTPGRFLVCLKLILDAYYTVFHNACDRLKTTRKDLARKKVLVEVGSSFAEEPASNLGIFSLELEFEKIEQWTYTELSAEIDTALNRIVSLTSMKGTRAYPFLILLDELDVFKFDNSPGRINGLNIIRRALHCLDISTNIFALAIGTNSDALDFTPAVRDNSLRFTNRPNILPPFILCGNFDVFSSVVDYSAIKLNRNSLLNRALFNVLVSFGRPIWSSCKLVDTMKLGEAKLKNGYSSSNGALLALLLVRANLTINVHHVLARTLIRSYMTIVNYVSTDANDMKIGYSSEPVLAMAARMLLRSKDSRLLSLLALREFLSQRAIDKGRVVEALFEYLLLFALDDSSSDDLIFTDNSDAVEFPLNVRKKLTTCQTFLLECQKKSLPASTSPAQCKDLALENVRRNYYHLISLERMISSILNGKFGEFMKKIIRSRTRRALVGSSHFLQLEAFRKKDFRNLPNFPNSKSTKRNVIDLALLKMGLLRQCGFIMPPGYFGIDFILPISIERGGDSVGDGLYSFVAVQAKASKQDIVECGFKMSAIFHICRCSNDDHLNEADCMLKNCKAYMKMADISAILEDQVVLLLAAKGPETRTKETTVSLKGRKASEAKTRTRNDAKSKTHAPKNDMILKDALIKFKDEMMDFVPNSDLSQVKSVDFPIFFNNVQTTIQPDMIITKHLNELVTIQKMVWIYNELDLENILVNECKRGKRRKMEIHLKKRSLTCIAIHDIRVLENLVGTRGISVMRDIIDFSVSNFENVDPLHKPIVQNSMIHGISSGYYRLNSMLRSIRGESSVLGNPLANYTDCFTRLTLKKSMDACILGPIDKIVNEPSDADYLLAEDEYKNRDYELFLE